MNDGFFLTKDLTQRYGKTRQTLWRWEKDGKFPKRRKLGKHSVGWPKAEIFAWDEARPVADPDPEQQEDTE